ncbi:MAG TPA: hypothetical protein VIL95_09050 [Bacillota bacterium]|jgi:MFS family permease
MNYVILPRRHSPRTLGLLLRWYLAAGAVGMLVAIAIAAILGLLGVPAESETFGVAFLVMLPLCALGMFLVWRRVVHPRIQLDRETARQEAEEFLNRRRL